MTSSAGAVAASVVSDPLALLAEAPLSEEEQGYVAFPRAVNTVRGYPSDWAEWCSWCRSEGLDAWPASALAISRYRTFLASH